MGSSSSLDLVLGMLIDPKEKIVVNSACNVIPTGCKPEADACEFIGNDESCEQELVVDDVKAHALPECPCADPFTVYRLLGRECCC